MFNNASKKYALTTLYKCDNIIHTPKKCMYVSINDKNNSTQ